MISQWFRTPQDIPAHAAHWEIALSFECPADAVTARFVAMAEWARSFVANSGPGHCVVLEEKHDGKYRLALGAPAHEVEALSSLSFLNRVDKAIDILEWEIRDQCARPCATKAVACTPTRDDFVRAVKTAVFHRVL